MRGSRVTTQSQEADSGSRNNSENSHRRRNTSNTESRRQHSDRRSGSRESGRRYRGYQTDGERVRRDESRDRQQRGGIDAKILVTRVTD